MEILAIKSVITETYSFIYVFELFCSKISQGDILFGWSVLHIAFLPIYLIFPFNSVIFVTLKKMAKFLQVSIYYKDKWPPV